MVDVIDYRQKAIEILQKLIRFDTSNPPGNEADCINYVNDLLISAGVETAFFARTPGRPNLVARLKGHGRAAPLLLQGHVDVVPVEGQEWRHPPFEGKIIDDCVWGRGALDMKGGVAMMLAALLRVKAENADLPGDVILALVSDEEAGGDDGAKYLVEQHPEQFAGVKYALSELGGFTLYVGGKSLYPIQVAEKQSCWMKATVRGPGGHGSMPVRGGAMAKLGAFLSQVDRRKLPVHITTEAKMMVEAIGDTLGGFKGLALKSLANPLLTTAILNLLGDQARLFGPLLRNTVSPTILHAGKAVNVIPSQVSVELDGRLLPGFTPKDMISELRAISGYEIEFEVLVYDPGPPAPDMGMYDLLADILRQADPNGNPVPVMVSGVTDARFFSRLGIQTYGFVPMKLPPGFDFAELIHGPNERAPIDAIHFGVEAICQVMRRFGAQ